LLSGFFGLLALWIFIHPPTASRKLNRFAGLIALSLALLCKPSAMVVPVVAALIAVLCQRRATRRVLVELIPWFLVAGTAAIIARIVQPASLIATLIPVWSRPFIAGDSLAFYFWKLIAPFGIVVDYGRKYPGIFNNPPHYAYWIWTIPTLILTLLWLNRRKWPMVWASALMFLAGLTPMLGLVPFEYQSYSNLADHYVYIAMLGPSLAVAAILATHNKLAIASAPAVLLLLATLSYRQTQVWLNDQDLFTHLQEVIPDNWVASHHLFRDALARDDYSEAETQARRFISQSPADAMAYFDLGQALRYQGHTSEAQSEFQTAMGIDPNSVPPIIGLAGLYEDEHRFDLAIALYRQALTLDPQNPDALTGLADSLEESQARPASQP
jgi:hypothetical protein